MGIDKDEIKRQVSIGQLLNYYDRHPNEKGLFQCLRPQNHNNGDIHHSGKVSDGRAFCNSQKCLGEKGADIFTLVGLMEDISNFSEQRDWIVEKFGLSNGTPQYDSGSILRAHQWVDAEGREAFHLRVSGARKFVWNSKADGSGVKRLAPCQPDLFQRDAVLLAQSGIVGAGERDCDTINQWLRELGKYPAIVATCNHTGENSVKAESFYLLHSKQRVYVVGDNDSTGKTYRDTVCGFLQGKVPTILPLRVPDKFNDITEWQEAGGTAEVFNRLLENATPWQPDPQQDTTEPAQQEEAHAGQTSIEGEIEQLAALSLLDYAKARKAEARRLEIGVGPLDALVKARRRELGKGKTPQGKEIVFEEIPPAEEEVNGSALLQRIVDILSRFLVLPPGATTAMALWVVHAYALDAFGVNPRLVLLSPEKRCGKTTAIDIFKAVVPKQVACSNISAAAIFRVVEKAAPTLILDEVDSFQEANEELRGILNSGHTKAAAHVIRNVGDDHEPRSFSTWCPMILAAIGSLPDTLEDRSIIVRMQRKKKADKVERLLQKVKVAPAFKADVDTIRRQCVRWVADHLLSLEAAESPMLDQLSDRANDNWSGLFAVAALCGSDWLKKAKTAALGLSGKESSSDTIGEQILTDIKAIFEGRTLDKISSVDLCEALGKIEERPWATWSRGYPITPVKVARLLDKYGIKSQTLRDDKETFKGYYRANFEDAWARYLFSSPGNQVSKGNTVTACMDKGETHDFQKVTDPPCYVSKNSTVANTGAGCDAVTFQNTQSQGREEKARGTSVLSYDEEEEFDVDV